MTGAGDKTLGIIPMYKASKMGTDSTACSKLAVVVDNKNFVLVKLKNLEAFQGNFRCFSYNQFFDVCCRLGWRNNVLDYRIKCRDGYSSADTSYNFSEKTAALEINLASTRPAAQGSRQRTVTLRLQSPGYLYRECRRRRQGGNTGECRIEDNGQRLRPLP